jgi:putative ABC transport system substrate-binding protein
MRRIGVLVGSADNPQGQSRVDAFRQTLRSLGWADERNVRIDIRWGAANAELTDGFAREIVGLAPDVILGETTPVVAAVLQDSRNIPIVFVSIRSCRQRLCRKPGATERHCHRFHFQRGLVGR